MKVFSLSLLVPPFFLFWLAWERSQLPYNSEGRFFDEVEGVVYHEQAVDAYVGLAVIFMLPSVVLAILSFSIRPPHEAP